MNVIFYKNFTMMNVIFYKKLLDTFMFDVHICLMCNTTYALIIPRRHTAVLYYKVHTVHG